MAQEALILFWRKQYFLNLAMDGSDLSLFCLSEKDLEMLTNYKSDQ